MLKKRIELGRSNAEEETREHTLLWWYVMNNKAAFNKLIVSQFQDNNQRETIEAVYDTFYG